MLYTSHSAHETIEVWRIWCWIYKWLWKLAEGCFSTKRSIRYLFNFTLMRLACGDVTVFYNYNMNKTFGLCAANYSTFAGQTERLGEREREISVIEKWSSYYIYIYHEQRLWLWLAPRLTDVKRRTMGHLQNCSSSSEKDKGNIFRPGTKTITGNGRRMDKWTGCCCMCLVQVVSTCLHLPRLAGTTKIPINSMRHNRHLGWLWGMSQHPKEGVAHFRGRLWALLCCRCLPLSCVCASLCVWEWVCVAKLKPLTFVCASMHYSYAAWPGRMWTSFGVNSCRAFCAKFSNILVARLCCSAGVTYTYKFNENLS